MIIRRKRRKVPGLNTASIADISFTLLILFLVVTSMDEEKGLTRLLPQMTQQKQSTEIADRNLMRLRIDGQNQIFIDDEPVHFGDIKQRVMTFVDEGAAHASQAGEGLSGDRAAAGGVQRVRDERVQQAHDGAQGPAPG